MAVRKEQRNDGQSSQPHWLSLRRYLNTEDLRLELSFVTGGAGDNVETIFIEPASIKEVKNSVE